MAQVRGNCRANSVLSDIIAVTKDIVLETTGSRFNDYVKNVALAPASDVIYPYYLSLLLPDKPGANAEVN